mmetsp:Transcript_18845/g.27791  ORF Transcript_18845/g.27791 Transcript_18845/m.27791 type:complete len:416 (+) Transcript_18845:59-1306(+)|eukprot:CAMPEP_0171462822 /NCGR_PEP_ID=MMETSP0945-20130129/6707_1 /TAXON_ID=109269 /ORGANISM="Vaucheria litorea, Strain CCMP2940" /LENGTH=415 /DNA_ID=CAMNT_0011989427 /DNA_START=73 /DNA_END=1320 /DNA_ORIENTATION=-
MKIAEIVAVFCAVIASLDAFTFPHTSTKIARPTKLFQHTGTGPSLDYNPEKYKDKNESNYRRLSDSLREADVEARKIAEEADRRERAAEIRRDERLAKVNKMKDMDDRLEVGTVDEHMYKEGIRDILDKLDYDLVGLVPVKKRVREIAALLVLDKMRGTLGFDTAVPSLHMCFTGAPGTGKTTVALRMGQILAKMGYCRLGHVVVATRDDLVGQYVGHTAPKTKEMIKKAFGGILLVDEAYYLYNASNDKDYGQESIEILLNVMEYQKEDLVVTLAGYKDRMDRFFSFIPGMSSRIGNHIDFPNYNKDELGDIARLMARELVYTMSDEAVKKFEEYIDLRMKFPFFSNARTVRNAMDRARMNSAIRVFTAAVSNNQNDGMVSPSDLATITEADFQILVDELIEYSKDGKYDAIVA